MRLINKNEIQTIKANERRQEIEVGLKLAGSVDKLRETHGKEELELNKFRTETVKIVQAEVDNLIRKKEELEYEIGVLERQNLNLKRPFDEEWELVKMKRLSDLDEELRSVKERETALRKGEFQFKFRDQELKLAELRVQDETLRSEKMLKESTLAREEAHDMIIEAKLKEADIDSRIDAKTNEYLKKEAEWVTKEKDLSMREEALRRSVKELVRREKFINDKYATLMRTESIIKNKK